MEGDAPEVEGDAPGVEGDAPGVEGDAPGADGDAPGAEEQARGAEEPAPAVVDFATRLFGLARAGSTDQLTAYVRAGVNATLANHKGDSLVMLAAYHGHAATVAALLKLGADPNRPNDRGQTPLAGAVFKGEPEVVSALVAGGADPEAGQPSAVATAQMFERGDLLELMRPGAGRSAAGPRPGRRDETGPMFRF